nr:immunoglobulin heavy chain junction region [Mus musculus]MBK4188235.1 immunoglobulin heavy chain junction region [Mus musculus]MBK4188236.1 immunoglobulin heavy chain junction region [Mus musculus]MBK4188237.1 immunoglobulin heavy chain junction region [Mus musculus]MBK4188238.1 immunoglobulin heavy chain junction region [Mus musculus]
CARGSGYAWFAYW